MLLKVYPVQSPSKEQKQSNSISDFSFSNDVVSLPPLRLDVLYALAGMRLGLVLVLGSEWIRIILSKTRQHQLHKDEVWVGMITYHLLQICQRVVDLAMLRLVGPHVEHQMPHRALVLGHLPVVDRNVGNLKVGIGPLGQVAGLDLLDDAAVGVHGFLLDVADEAVARPRRQQVREEHAVEEDALRAQDGHLHEPSRFGELHEGEEVHPLVVGFFEKGFDPVRAALARSSSKVRVCRSD